MRAHDRGGEVPGSDRRLGPASPDYPPHLRAIPDPPDTLWVRGRLTAEPAVAIVGSRRCTAYGSRVAHRLARDLASRGLVVVSGMARGIDAAAHRGALDADGRTIAVLPGGLDPVYPTRHRALAAAIAAEGALLAEHEPGTKVWRAHFPRRNRIIAGISLVVVVVEAAVRSGARITADLALGYGREVMVVPGPVTSPTSAGCHALLGEGAHPCTTATDVLEQLPASVVRELPGRTPTPGDLDREAHRVLRLLAKHGEMDVAEIARILALPIREVLVTGARLQLLGLARQVGGTRFAAC